MLFLWPHYHILPSSLSFSHTSLLAVPQICQIHLYIKVFAPAGSLPEIFFPYCLNSFRFWLQCHLMAVFPRYPIKNNNASLLHQHSILISYYFFPMAFITWQIYIAPMFLVFCLLPLEYKLHEGRDFVKLLYLQHLEQYVAHTRIKPIFAKWM